MLQVLALFFGPLLIVVGLVCSDALASPQTQDAGGTASSGTNPAHYVVLAALAVCFVSLMALFGRTH